MKRYGLILVVAGVCATGGEVRADVLYKWLAYKAAPVEARKNELINAIRSSEKIPVELAFASLLMADVSRFVDDAYNLKGLGGAPGLKELKEFVKNMEATYNLYRDIVKGGALFAKANFAEKMVAVQASIRGVAKLQTDLDNALARAHGVTRNRNVRMIYEVLVEFNNWLLNRLNEVETKVVKREETVVRPPVQLASLRQ